MFGNFKHDVDNIIDDTKHIITDVEEIGDDFKYCYKKWCLKYFLYRICSFLEQVKMIFFLILANIIKINKTMAKVKRVVRYMVGNKTYTKKSTAHRVAVWKKH